MTRPCAGEFHSAPKRTARVSRKSLGHPDGAVPAFLAAESLLRSFGRAQNRYALRCVLRYAAPFARPHGGYSTLSFAQPRAPLRVCSCS